jgi:septal ring factor EnvC (AmiA/AmiB activator)
MARPPSKRRGIALGPRADSAASLDRLNAQCRVADSSMADQTEPAVRTAGGETGTTPNAILEQLDRLRLGDAERDAQLRELGARLHDQLRQLEDQRDQLAQQSRQLQALTQTRGTPGRLGVLLALMAVAGVAALGYHTWPRLQDVAGGMSRLSTSVAQLAPQLQSVGGEVTVLTAEMQQAAGVLASLRHDLAVARSDLGSLRQTVDALPERKGPVQVDAGARRGDPATLPRNATTMSNPYWAMGPRRPW